MESMILKKMSMRKFNRQLHTVFKPFRSRTVPRSLFSAITRNGTKCGAVQKKTEEKHLEHFSGQEINGVMTALVSFFYFRPEEAFYWDMRHKDMQC